MKKGKYIITVALMILSFYVTDKVMIFIESKNPLMISIMAQKDDYYIKPVDAIIANDTVIPGIYGREVDEHKSLLKMEEFGVFNELYLRYNYLKPSISLDDNKDKIIIKGNNLKRAVSFILNDNEEIKNYFESNDIKYTYMLTKTGEVDKNHEYINGSQNKEVFSDINTLLKKIKSEKICLINYSNEEECLKKDYYLVRYSVDTNESIIDVLNSITSGSIIFINRNLNSDNLLLILNEIKRLDLDIVYLKDLISEK